VIKTTHTATEILSQPDVWKKTLDDWSQMDISAFPNPYDYDQQLFIGCGSTFFLSRWAAAIHEKNSGKISRAAPSSDVMLHPACWLSENRHTLLVASSRSAATTESILAIDLFTSQFPGDVVVVTCNPDEKMGQQSHYVLGAVRANEQSIAQTRSFTSMMLAQAWLLERQVPDGMGQHLQEAGQRLLENYRERLSHIARDKTIQRYFFLGSGPLYGLANEAMLKMKEISLSYAESFHSLEFRHGPMAMVDDHTLVIGLLGEDGVDEDVAVLRDMKAKGARAMAIAEVAPKNSSAIDELVLLKSGLPLLWRSVLYLPALQWLACEHGLSKGLDPDKPHNLDAVVVLDG